MLLLTFILVNLSCSEGAQETLGTVHVKHTESGWVLFRNNKPFKIKGASGRNRYKELSAAGANTIRIYDTTYLKESLDSAHTFGLAVIADLPITRYTTPDTTYNNAILKEKQLSSLKNTVKKYKNHPALLYWILGNEINYPDNPINNEFVAHYNQLLDMIRLEDPNHPVSTAVGGFDRSKVLAIKNFSPLIEIVSLNIFGELSTFQERYDNIAWMWKGPYVITEFGINGPWEATKTTWSAPIEETSTKKAEQYKYRYSNYVDSRNEDRCLGTMFFYWGSKQERTHTWFSTHDDDGRRNEVALEMENIWKEENGLFSGPKIKYILMNGKGAPESLVLMPGASMTMELLMENPEVLENATVEWELREENWNYLLNEVEKRPGIIRKEIASGLDKGITWSAPLKEGPYRIFLTVMTENTFATSNIPFYVLQ